MSTIQKITELFEKSGKSASWILKELNFSPTSLSEWKRGKSKPTADALTKIADYFDVSVDYLLGRSTPNLKPLDSLTSSVLDICDKLSPENKTKLLAYAKGLSDAT